VIDSIEERNVRAASVQKIGKELSSEGAEKTGRRRWLGKSRRCLGVYISTATASAPPDQPAAAARTGLRCVPAPFALARAPNKTAGETGVVAGGTQHRRCREGVVVGDARPHGGEVTVLP
jgi:hypothetical protein